MTVKQYTGRANINIYHGDCMEFMKDKPAKSYELCIVDPPYGIGADVKNNGKNSDRHEKTSLAKINIYKKTNWDNFVPNNNYFENLYNISIKQIIWGANYFGLSGGMLYWHKDVTMPTYSSGELAWLSWLNKIDFVNITWHGMLQNDMQNKEIRQHPTQKPVALYKWLLQNYAKEGDKILDTHGGSMSIAIACWDLGFDLDIIELDKDYYDKAVERFERHINQKQLF
jgi:site-specific DNA-methyltransferase (adenine-specific)